MRISFILFLTLFLPPAVFASSLKVGPNIALTAGFPGDTVGRPAVAYNSKHDEFFIVYAYKNSVLATEYAIHGARISSSGEYIAVYDNISSDLAGICLEPVVAYDPVTDRYLVAWQYAVLGEPFTNIWARFINYNGPDDTISSFPVTNATALTADPYFFLPKIAFNPDTRQFLLIFSNWYTLAGDQFTSRIRGRKVDADSDGGAIFGPSYDISILSASGSRGNPDIVYNSTRKEFLIVYDNYSSSANPIDFDIFGIRYDGNTLTALTAPFSVAAWPGEEDFPHVSYNDRDDQYFVTWVADADISPKIYGRFLSGDGSPGSAGRIDDVPAAGGSDVSYDARAHGYLITWPGRDPQTLLYYLAARFMRADGVPEQGKAYDLIGPGGQFPVVASSGNGRWALPYASSSADFINTVRCRLLFFRGFPWAMYLPAIRNR